MPNRINWTIVHYKPPEAMTLDGDGRGRRQGQAHRQGEARHRTAVRRSPSTCTWADRLCSVPIGMLVAGALKSDIRESLNRFKSVFAPA